MPVSRPTVPKTLDKIYTEKVFTNLSNAITKNYLAKWSQISAFNFMDNEFGIPFIREACITRGNLTERNDLIVKESSFLGFSKENNCQLITSELYS